MDVAPSSERQNVRSEEKFKFGIEIRIAAPKIYPASRQSVMDSSDGEHPLATGIYFVSVG